MSIRLSDATMQLLANHKDSRADEAFTHGQRLNQVSRNEKFKFEIRFYYNKKYDNFTVNEIVW